MFENPSPNSFKIVAFLRFTFTLVDLHFYIVPTQDPNLGLLSPEYFTFIVFIYFKNTFTRGISKYL